ncbi:unnamed protein product [Urochloa humidicola]
MNLVDWAKAGLDLVISWSFRAFRSSSEFRFGSMYVARSRVHTSNFDVGADRNSFPLQFYADSVLCLRHINQRTDCPFPITNRSKPISPPQSREKQAKLGGVQAPMASAGSGDEAAAPTMITLISSDNEKFEVAESVATLSQTIRHMIEDGCTDGGVPLPNVTGKILAMVIEYCNKHASSGAEADAAGEGSSSSAAAAVPSTEELKKFDDGFLEVDQVTLFDLILAANYLDVKGLLDITCQKVADMMKGKQPEEIREIFQIENDFTPEEEAEIRKENQWAFE